MTFTIACKKYFGLKPGQTLQDFGKELATVPEKDRLELIPMLSAELKEEVTLA